MFSRSYSSSLFFYQFRSLNRSNTFRFSMKLSFNLHTWARHIALKLTLSNAPSGSSSHLATGHVSKSKGAIERLFLRLPQAFYTAVIQNGRREGL